MLIGFEITVDAGQDFQVPPAAVGLGEGCRGEASRAKTVAGEDRQANPGKGAVGLPRIAGPPQRVSGGKTA